MRARREVVTCFLSNGERVLALKRSPAVSTYRGLWGGVSGSIGEHPVAQAFRELWEELKVPPDAVRLLRMAAPLRVEDRALETVWEVHGFLFRLQEDTTLRLDWEHDQARWVTPEELAALPTVPGLTEVLSRVWVPSAPEVPAAARVTVPPVEGEGILADFKVSTLLMDIAGDRVHGAARLGRRALDALVLAGDHSTASTPEGWWLDVRRVGARLAVARPSMASLAHHVARALHRMNGPLPETVDKCRAALHAAVRAVVREDQEAMHAAAEALSGLLTAGERVMTLSRSAVVETALRLAAQGGRRLEVVVPEGRPGFEGRELARSLARLGHRPTLITDAAMALFVGPDIQAVIGADTLLPDGSAVNKTGSRLLALACRERGVPFRVASPLSKLDVRPGNPHGVPLEEWPGEEIWSHSVPGLSVRNVAYEPIPPDLISGFVTEEGIIDPPRLREAWRRRKALTHLLAGLLAEI